MCMKPRKGISITVKIMVLVVLPLTLFGLVSAGICYSKQKDMAYTLISQELRSLAFNVADQYDLLAEGNYSYGVAVKDLKANIYELTITEEGRMDDSVSGLMSVLKVEKKDSGFVVLEIKEAYKCWPNRGHQDWSAEFCS